MGYVKRFFEVTGKGLDAAAKLYASCVEESDYAAKCRLEQMKAQEAENLRQYCLNLEGAQYLAFARIVIEVVTDNAEACGLETPKREAQILAPWGQGVSYIGTANCFIYEYRLRREIERSGIKDGKFSVEYKNVPELLICQTLNAQINNYTRLHCCFPVSVIQVSELSPGIISAKFAPVGRQII